MELLARPPAPPEPYAWPSLPEVNPAGALPPPPKYDALPLPLREYVKPAAMPVAGKPSPPVTFKSPPLAVPPFPPFPELEDP